MYSRNEHQNRNRNEHQSGRHKHWQNRNSSGSGGKSAGTRTHLSFAARQLLQDIFGHYRNNKTVGNILNVTYFNVPAIQVEVGRSMPGRDDAEEYDTWQWMGRPYNCVTDRLPKQILRFYRQERKVMRLQSAQFYEEDGKTLVEVDRGDECDVWSWEPSEDEKFFCWRLMKTEESDGDPEAISFPAKWTLVKTEIEDEDEGEDEGEDEDDGNVEDDENVKNKDNAKQT